MHEERTRDYEPVYSGEFSYGKKHTFTYINILIRFEMKELFDDIIRGLRPAQNRIMARLHFLLYRKPTGPSVVPTTVPPVDDKSRPSHLSVGIRRTGDSAVTQKPGEGRVVR